MLAYYGISNPKREGNAIWSEWKSLQFIKDTENHRQNPNLLKDGLNEELLTNTIADATRHWFQNSEMQAFTKDDGLYVWAI